MLHRILTAMAAALCMAFISGTADAKPNKALSFYAGKSAETARPDSIRIGAGKAKKAVHESRSGRNALSIARRYIGTNPTGWRRLWCAQVLRGEIPRSHERRENLIRECWRGILRHDRHVASAFSRRGIHASGVLRASVRA